MAGGGEGVPAAEEEAVDGVPSAVCDSCPVKMAAVASGRGERREEEVEVGVECGVWFVGNGISTSVRTVNWC